MSSPRAVTCSRRARRPQPHTGWIEQTDDTPEEAKQPAQTTPPPPEPVPETLFVKKSVEAKAKEKAAAKAKAAAAKPNPYALASQAQGTSRMVGPERNYQKRYGPLGAPRGDPSPFVVHPAQQIPVIPSPVGDVDIPIDTHTPAGSKKKAKKHS